MDAFDSHAYDLYVQSLRHGVLMLEVMVLISTCASGASMAVRVHGTYQKAYSWTHVRRGEFGSSRSLLRLNRRIPRTHGVKRIQQVPVCQR